MRYLLITPEFPPTVGGVSRYLGILADGQKEMVVQQHLSGHWISVLWKIRGWAGDVDCVLISHLLPYGYAAFFSGKPFVVICHGLDVVGPLKNPWKKFWAHFILRRARKIVANSNVTKNILQHSYNLSSEKIAVVHPPLSWDQVTISKNFETHFAEQYGLKNKLTLLIVGRLVERKGVDVAIKAMKIVSETFPNAVLCVVGDGPERENLQRCVSLLQAESQVILVGKKEDAEIRDAYRAATIVLYPSKQCADDVEGFGMSAADAGIFGKAVIASRTGGLGEAIDDGVTVS